jgi:hypothetical protein
MGHWREDTCRGRRKPDIFLIYAEAKLIFYGGSPCGQGSAGGAADLLLAYSPILAAIPLAHDV